MFLFSEEKKPIIQNEQDSVKYFLENSYYFKQMKKSAWRYKPECGKSNDLLQWVKEVQDAKCYGDVKRALNHFDVDQSDNLFAYNMGRNKMSYLMGAFGFIWERPNFFYYAIELLRSVEKACDDFYRLPRLG